MSTAPAKQLYETDHEDDSDDGNCGNQVVDVKTNQAAGTSTCRTCIMAADAARQAGGQWHSPVRCKATCVVSPISHPHPHPQRTSLVAWGLFSWSSRSSALGRWPQTNLHWRARWRPAGRQEYDSTHTPFILNPDLLLCSCLSLSFFFLALLPGFWPREGFLFSSFVGCLIFSNFYIMWNMNL